MQIKHIIGQNIERARLESKTSRQAIAARLGKKPRTIDSWIYGQCMPPAEKIPELCSMLGIDPNDLFTGTGGEWEANNNDDSNA